MDNSAAEPSGFSWLTEAIAAVAVAVTILIAWVQDRLTINQKITALETKMDLLIDLQKEDRR